MDLITGAPNALTLSHTRGGGRSNEPEEAPYPKLINIVWLILQREHDWTTVAI